MIFEYWGFSRGTTLPVHNIITVDTEPAAYKWFSDNNILVTRVRPYEGRLSQRSKLTTGELIDFFSSLQFNAYNIANALDGYAKLCPNAKFQRVVQEMAASCRDRKTLAGAAARFTSYFPSWLLSFLAAGEESGTLPASIEQILGILHAEEETDDDIAAGFQTLRFIVRLGLGLIALYIYVFLPTVKASLLAIHQNLTGITGAIFAADDFFHNVYAVGALAAVYVAWLIGRPILMRQEKVRRWVERRALKIPAIKTLIATDQTARVARMLGNIIPSGLPLARATQMASSITTWLVYREAMHTVTERAEKHATLTKMFEGLAIFDYRFLLRIDAAKTAPLRPQKTKNPDEKKVKSQCDACIESADFLSRIKKRLLRTVIHSVSTWGTVGVMSALMIVSILAFIPYFTMIKRLLIGF